MNSINIAIIGLGAIGQRLLPVIKNKANYHVIGGYDVDKTLKDRVCSDHGIWSYERVVDLIKDDRVEAVYLAVPPKYHEDLALRILEAGKHLLCEKPLADTVEAARRMAEAASKSDRVACMNFPLPYTSGVEEMRDCIQTGQLGLVKRIAIDGEFPDWPRKWQVNPWIDTRAEGGFVREVFTHLIQLVIMTYGPIDHIRSFPQYPKDSNLSERGIIAYGQAGQIPVSFNGISHISHKEHLSLCISGDKASICLENWRDLVWIDQEGPRPIETLGVNPTEVLLDNFHKRIQGQEAYLVDFDMGYETVRVVETLLGNHKEELDNEAE